MSPGRNSGASRTRTREPPRRPAGSGRRRRGRSTGPSRWSRPPRPDPQLLGPEQHVDVAAQAVAEWHPPDGGVGQPGRGHPGEQVGVAEEPATAREAGARYSSAGAACCTIRPASITATSSPTTNASSWSWVTNTAVTPRSASSRCTSARIWTRRMVSRLENGSSSSSTDGRVTSAPARATRWAWPPDRLAGRRSPSRPGRPGPAPRRPRDRGARAATARSRRCRPRSGGGTGRRPGTPSRSGAARGRRSTAGADRSRLQADLAGVGPLQPGDAAQQGRLAAAAGPEQGHHPAGRDRSPA